MNRIKKYSIGLEYSISDGVATLCGIGSCEDKNLVVPTHTPEGYPIVAIADKAFTRNTQIKGVVLSETIKTIGKMAFAWCISLCSIEINATEVGERAFMGCDLLGSVKLGNGLTSLGEKAFAYCPALASVDLPDTVKSVGISAFEGCRNLRYARLPRKLNILENGIFYACTSLCRVEMPENLEYIDEYAFAYCISVSELDISRRTVINSLAFYECDSKQGIKVS